MLPRGIRNNNPLNIRIGNKWVGEVENPTDPDFEQFTSMLFGVRAGFVLIRRYIERYHLNTISEIVSRWAPSSENNTSNYIRVLVERTGIGPLEKLDFGNRKQMVCLVDAMIFVECGTTIANDIIEKAYLMVAKPQKKML